MSSRALPSSKHLQLLYSFHPIYPTYHQTILTMATIEQAPLLPQDLEDGTSSAIPEAELQRPEGITEVKAPRAPARA